MSFNWPDIPFSGTEVDAFVVAYKEFAQDVLDAYLTEFDINNSVEHIYLPYMTRENMKIYLEKALLYSAFVVKQRAGNSGAGTDFILGNSPLGTPLSGPQSQSLLKRLGCSFENDKVDLCYENGDRDNPDDLTVAPNNPPPENEDVAVGAMGTPYNTGNNNDDKGGPPPPCPEYSNNYNGGGPKTINAGETQDRSLLWKTWAGTLKTVGLGLALVQGRGSMHVAGDLLLHYLNGSGAQYTQSGLIVADTLGSEIKSYANQYSSTSKVRELSVSAAQRSGYGMDSNDRLYAVDFHGYLWLSAAFGNAIIITDGNENNVGDIIGDISYVKGVIDDYDFRYAYEIGRNTGLPGLPLSSEDVIRSGPNLCPDPNDPSSGKSTCEAITSDGHSNLQYVVRLPVAEAHGDGCRDIDSNSNSGRPFPVYIKFNRTSGNGL